MWMIAPFFLYVLLRLCGEWSTCTGVSDKLSWNVLKLPDLRRWITTIDVPCLISHYLHLSSRFVSPAEQTQQQNRGRSQWPVITEVYLTLFQNPGVTMDKVRGWPKFIWLLLALQPLRLVLLMDKVNKLQPSQSIFT
jgi:hypothetical protein